MFGQSSRVRQKTEESLAPISAFESETQAVIGQAAPYSDRAIVHAVGILFIVAIFLMCVIKLDRVVTSTGLIIPTGGSIYIQPLGQALVRKIEVRVGDVVRKGQVLATLDPTFATADQTSLQQKAASDAALAARLQAEAANTSYVPKGADSYQLQQLATFHQVMAEKNQTLANYDAQISSTETLISQAQSDAVKYRQEVDSNSEIVSRWRDLEKQGYGAPMQALTARTALTEAERQLADANSQFVKSSHDLEALRAQRAAYIGAFFDTLGTALTTARNDLSQSSQDLIKAQKTNELTRLVSPVDAVVLKVADASVGTVVQPSAGTAEPLFTLTPVAGASEAEVDIAARDQAFIKPGDTVRLKLDAYKFILHGTAEGVVETISAGSFTVDQNGQPVAPYFKVRVRITKAQLHNVPKDFRLLPGMTLVGDIIVGRRTIMTYLVEGALRTGREAMREP